MPAANSASNFWNAIAQCRTAFWNGDADTAQSHITAAARLVGPPLDRDGGRDEKQKIDLLEKLAELYRLDLKLASIAVSNDDKAFDHISPDGIPGISIVTCSKNRTENLIKALRTWLPHDQVKEIVIVDWCSDRPVRAALDEAGVDDFRIRIIRVEDAPLWILSPAFNLGFRFTRHETILKLDADITLSADFFDKNPLPADGFIAGNWRRAREGQAFVNGFFYTTKAALAQVGGFNEYLSTNGGNDDDLYDRLVLHGRTYIGVTPHTVSNLDHTADDRPKHQKTARSVAQPDTAALSARRQLCTDAIFPIRRNRMIAALMPPWDSKSALMPVTILAYGAADILVRQDKRTPGNVPNHIEADADFYVLSDLLSSHLGPRVRELDHRQLDRLLQKPMSDISLLDVEIALSNRPDVMDEARFCVLSISNSLIDTEGVQVLTLLQELAERVRTKGYCPVLRLDTARLPEDKQKQLLQAYPCLGPLLKLGQLTKTAIETLGTPDLPHKVMVSINHKIVMQDDGIDPEPDLRIDPSRADLWAASAAAYRQRGNDARARLLLRRACASGFPARDAAQQALTSWVEEAYNQDRNTNTTAKAEAI